MKIKKRIKWINIFLAFVFLISIFFIVYSSYNIILWVIDNKNIEENVEQIEEIIDVKEVLDNEKTEIIEQKEKVPKDNPYWSYIKMNLIDVNFDELKTKNKDTKGWIQVNGTNINYPFVQSNDNSYYLTHAFDKSKNSAGWIFLDYRNDIKSNNNKNTILYGHGRLDTTMFGSLKNILKSNWYENKDNYVIKMSTEKENSLWQVFSVYHIPTTTDYIQTDFSTDNEYNEFLKKLINRSAYNFNTNITSNDRIITLSTCYNEKERVVMHAKLIKKVVKLS